MNENNTYQELDLFDIVCALLKKAKLIICVTLATLIVGAGFGAITAVIANKSFGTTAEFYVYSDKANSQILSFVQSDSFAENLLLNEYCLPETYKDTDDYKKALEIKKNIETLEEELEKLNDKVEEYPRLVTDAQRLSVEAQNTYNEIYDMLAMYKSVDASTVTPEGMVAHNAKIGELEVKLEEARASKDAAKKAYNDVLLEQEDAKEAVTDAEKEIVKLEKEAAKAAAPILVKFRTQSENAHKIQKIKESITYTFAESEDTSSQALLLVKISVDDKEFATFLLDKISSKLPDFVANDTLSDQEPVCEYISTFSTVERIEERGLVSSIVKFGLLGLGAGLVITSCVVMVGFAFKRRKSFEESNNG